MAIYREGVLLSTTIIRLLLLSELPSPIGAAFFSPFKRQPGIIIDWRNSPAAAWRKPPNMILEADRNQQRLADNHPCLAHPLIARVGVFAGGRALGCKTRGKPAFRPGHRYGILSPRSIQHLGNVR